MINFLCNAMLIFVLLLVTAGCAAKSSLVVLVPDPDGKTGRVTVANQAGKVELASPNQGTAIKGAEVPPASPAAVDKTKIDAIFADALSIQPKQPLHVILYFAKDTTLSPESEKLLPDILLAIKERNSTDISIVGHTDTVGSREYNMTLSRARADAVKEILVHRGVAAETIATTSHGMENPLIPTAANVNEPRNRRAEVVIR